MNPNRNKRDLPPSQYRDKLQNPDTRQAVLKWARLETLDVMTSATKPCVQYQRADFLADEVVRLSLLLEEMSRKVANA